MKVDRPRRKNTLWDIEFEERVPDARLAAFDRHKAALLAHLRNVHKRGLKSEPFDADKSWRDLTRLVQFYFWWTKMKQETMPAADRVERLRELEKALGRARGMADKAMQDDVGLDLFGAWFAGTNIPLASVVLDDGGSSVLTRIADEIKNVVASLATLETAAHRAAHDVRTERGRPKGTSVLPSDYIIALADLYRRSTGLKPGAGDGPFARFVGAFLTAIGRRDDILDASINDAIKDARTHSRQNPKGRGLSPFG
jgi:hypothetical protein